MSIFGSNLKKKHCKKYHNFFLIWKTVYSDRLNSIFKMKQSEFKISISVESYQEKTVQQVTILLRWRKAHSFQTIRDIDLKFWYHKLKTWLKILSKFQVPNFHSFWKIICQRSLGSSRAGSVWMSTRRPMYMTANRNFVCLAHS